jgi:hypothetical protein
MSAKIKFLNIVTTNDGIYEYEGDALLLFVPRQDIENLNFGLASPTRWPLLVMLLGIVLICVGVFLGIIPLVGNVLANDSPSLPNLKGYAFMALNLVPGLYFSSLSLKKQNCLILQTRQGVRKLILKGSVDKDRLQEFIKGSESMMKEAT